MHAALELLHPAQLLLAGVLALLVVTQSVLQGLAGQLAQRRLGDMGMDVLGGVYVCFSTVPAISTTPFLLP